MTTGNQAAAPTDTAQPDANARRLLEPVFGRRDGVTMGGQAVPKDDRIGSPRPYITVNGWPGFTPPPPYPPPSPSALLPWGKAWPKAGWWD